MVRANHRDFEIDALERAETRHHRREQHRDVDSLAIHILDAHVRIEAAAHVGPLAMRIAPGAHQRLVGSGNAQWTSGIQLMEVAEEDISTGALAATFFSLSRSGLNFASR